MPQNEFKTGGMRMNLRTILRTAGAALATTAVLGFASANALAKPPLKIGFSMSLTGFLSAVGKQGLLGIEIWRDQINKEGGLLGRKDELVYYDDKSAPQEVPGVYTKLLDVDNVALVVSGYATNVVTPAMPVIMSMIKL